MILFAGGGGWVRTNPNAGWHRKIGRAIFGSRAERDYRAFSRKVESQRLFVKDPFCLFVSPLLVERFDARVVITLRHLGAWIDSMRRMGWKSPIASLVAQPGLVAHYLHQYTMHQLTEGAAVSI